MRWKPACVLHLPDAESSWPPICMATVWHWFRL